MFELTNQQVRLANVNLRAELHGEDPKPAADLKIEAKLSNDALAQFHPTLKHFLYSKDEEQPDLVSAQDNERVTRLRMPKLGPLKWDTELVGARVVVHHGVNGKGDIDLEGCNVNSFTLTAEEGGTVAISFRAQAHPDEKQIGKLSTLIGKDVEISVEPPDSVD